MPASLSSLKSHPNADNRTADAEKVASAFREKSKIFTGSSAYAEASVARDSQINLWRQLLSSPPRDNATQDLFNHIRDRLDHVSFGLHDKGDDKFVVQSELPFLTETGVSFLAQVFVREPYLVAAAIAAEASPITSNFQQPNSLPLLVALNRYFNGGLHPKDVGEEFLNTKRLLDEQYRHSSQAIDKATASLDLFVEEKKADVEAFKKSLSESFYLRSSTDLWKTRADNHGTAHMSWFAVFVVSILAFVALIYWKSDVIALLLPRDKDNNVSYAGLVLFLVPIVGFGWLLRIISRFINTNQTLRDDASHRDTMLKTYLALVADKDAKLDDKDRVIILNAIFRPLPGTQAEDVAPPSVLDLIKR